MNVNNASNGGRVHGLFFVNWIAPCPLGALNQVLARCVIQRIGNTSYHEQRNETTSAQHGSKPLRPGTYVVDLSQIDEGRQQKKKMSTVAQFS